MSITVPSSGDDFSSSLFGDPVANTLNGFMLGSATSTTSVTLSTTSAFAGSATVTFTLSAQTRVKITTLATMVPNGTSSARYDVQAGYNSGSSASIGSVVKVGIPFLIGIEGGGTTGRNQTGIALGTVLLSAGTYTAYASITRTSGGDAGDAFNSFQTLVEFCGYT